MAKLDANVVLYAVDLNELREWIGCKDQKRFDEAWTVIQEDEDWDDEEWEDAAEMMQDLLKRLVFEGKLYEGLNESERYLLTQILVDLFDEFVDQDALTEDIPLDRFLQIVEELPRGSEAARLGRSLLRGREINGDAVLWEGGPDKFVSPYFGYVTREEAPLLIASLDEAAKRSRSRPSGLIKQLRAAAEECVRAEMDLLSYIG
jgi:hypothetical protein